MSQKQQRIAIIGGGPGGLSLARLLQLGDKSNHYAVKVYERDMDASVRIQGGSLDLHVDSGQIFIDKAQLRKEYDAIACVDGGYYSLYTQNDEKVWDVAIPQHPELDRNNLRILLLNSLEPGTVEWNKHLVKIDDVQGGGFLLHFKNQAEPVYCDAIIGADGSLSKVRTHIAPTIKPKYSGITLIQGDILNPMEKCPEMVQKVNHGNMWVFGKGGRSIALQQKGDGTLIYYASFKVPEDWMEVTHGVDYSTHDPEVFRRIMLDIFEGYEDSFIHLIGATDEFALRKMYGLMYRSTLDVRWNAFDGDRPTVTLIGDAAHVMPSFAGVGVNNAMMDAVELAEEIFAGGNGAVNISAAFSAYEQRMYKRCIPAAQLTEIMEDAFHDSDDNVTALTKRFVHFANIELDDHWTHLLD